MQTQTRLQALTRRIATAIFVAALAGTALAQSPATTEPPAATSPGATDSVSAQVTDAQLENFASAQKEVEQIRTKYVEEAQSKQDPQKLAEAEAKMQKEMVEAVEDNELDVPTYNRIAQLLPHSSELQQRLQQIQ